MITLENLTDPKMIAVYAVFLSNIVVYFAGKKPVWTPERKTALGTGCVVLVFFIGLVLNPDAYLKAGDNAVQQAFLVLVNALVVLLTSMGAPILKDALLMVTGKYYETTLGTENRGGAASVGAGGAPAATFIMRPTPKKWRAWTS